MHKAVSKSHTTYHSISANFFLPIDVLFVPSARKIFKLFGGIKMHVHKKVCQNVGEIGLPQARNILLKK